MKYGVFDSEGNPKAFYDSEINGKDIPEEAVELTDENYIDLRDGQGSRVYVDQVVTDKPSPTENQVLDGLKQSLIARLESEQLEQARLRRILSTDYETTIQQVKSAKTATDLPVFE